MQRHLSLLPLRLVFASILLAAFPAVAQTPGPAASPAPAGSPALFADDGVASLFTSATPGGLTADAVAARAVKTSHEVRAQGEAQEAALAGVSEARAAFVPRLSGIARYTRLSPLEQPSLGNLVAVGPTVPAGQIAAGTPLFAVPLTFPVIEDQYVTQATLSLPVSDYLYRLPKVFASARGNARAAALLEQATAVRVAADARIAYYDWLRARLQAEVAERSLAQAQAHLKDVTVSSTSGVASKADVLRVESQVAAAELLLTRARSATLVAEERLRTLMHDRGAERYAVGESLEQASVAGDLLQNARRPLEELAAEAFTRRLEPRALRESAEAAQAQAGAQRAAGMPRLDAVGNAYYSRPNQRVFPQEDEFRGTWDVGLQLTWAPTDIFGTEAGRRATLAKSRELEAERQQLADGITVEVTQARQALLDSAVAISSANRGLVAAEESYRVRRVLFQHGRATSVELTDAEIEQVRAQLEAITTRIDQRVATVRLRHALGLDVGAVETPRPGRP